VLATNLDTLGSAELTDRIRGAVTDRQTLSGLPVRASVGAAASPPASSLGEALLAADRILYEAKARRRASQLEVAS
jgi:GGDEF domain-containing protein